MVHLPGGITLDVTLRNRSIGELSTAIALDFDGGEAHLVSEGAELFSGYVMWSGDPMAHRIEANGPGRVRLTEIDAKDIACSSRMPNGELRGGIPLPPGIDPDAPPPAAAAAALGPVAIPPPLDSVPGSTAVIYLDFDGQTVTGTPWNTAYTSGAPIVAEPSTLSDNTIHGVWKRVAEDFAPFNISVTNIESRYLNAPQNRRIRIIITPSYEWYGTGAGGVAYYGSFRNSGDTPAWVFESRVGYTEKNVSEVCSHEAGHTFDLRHDGLDVADEEYYSGHGTGATSWAPIMGVGYSRTIVQWSKGDYYDANRTEDDLALIASASNGISFRVDQYANTTASAQTISHNAQTGAVNVSGVIETGSDADVFRIPAFGGPLSLVVSMTGQSDSPSPNMDVRAELLNSAGVVIETANPAGATTATINRNLTTGTYYLRVSGSNFGSPLAANPTGYTDYGSIGQYWITGNFNTIPPPPPTDLDPASDSGVSNSDNLTKITTPTFNGTANAGGANIFLTSSLDGVVGTAPVNGSGNYTVVSSTLREGIHSMTVRQGTGPESAELVVTIDTTASVPQRPDLTDPTDSGFSNTDNITNITNPMFSVTSETGGFTELLRNGIVVGSATSTGADIINPGVFSEGAHTITARSTDRAGNTSGASLPLNVTIDTTPPAVPQQPDLTSASDSGVSNTDNLTNVAIPSFVTVSEPGNLIELLANGAVVGGATSTGTNTITSSPLTDGLKSITARTTDVAGNVSAPSASLAVTIDTTAPIPPTAMRVTAATDTGLSQSDNITSNTNPVISGNSEAGAKVYVTVDGVAAGSHPTGGSWTLPLTSLANGVRLVRARAEDPAGNLGFDSAALSVTIDTIPPAAPTALRLSPATDTGISNTDNLTRLNNPSLIGSAENGARVTIFRDGVSQGTANSGGTWAFATSGLAEGIHAYSARQTDPAGNDGPLSGAVNISVDLTPPAPASAPLLNPSSDTGASNSDRVTRLQSLVFSGSSEAGGRVTLLAGATPLGTTGSNGAWSLTSAPIIAGTHLIRARAEDAAGNEALEDSPPTEVTIVLSAAPPANVRLDPSSDLGFSDTDAITSDTTPLIAGDSPAGSTIQLSIGDPPSEIPLGSGPGGPGWTVQSGLLPAGDGFKTIKAKVLDLAGNLSAAATVQIEIRTSTPAAPIGLNLKVGSDTGASATDKITRINTPTVTGLVNLGGRPSVRIRLESNGQLVGLATTTTQSWEVVTDPLPDGVHEIRARSEDFAGNLSAPSTVPMTVTIDTVAPAAPGTLRVAEEDDTGFSSSDNVTRITRPRIVGIAEPGPVVLFINGNQHPGTLDSDGTWSYRPDAPLPEGVTQFRARQSDLAGNQGPDSATLAVTIDTTPPPAGPISPPRLHPASDLGPLDNDRVTADNTPLLFGTTGPGEVATLVIDGTESGSVVADGTGAWTFESPELPDGPHSIVARRSDLAGNLGATSAPLNLTIDTDGPLVSIFRAAGQASTTVGEPIRFAVAFTQPVFGFGSGDVSVTGAAGIGSMVTVIGADGGTDYLVEIAGTTGEGLVRVDIPADGATDLAGNPHPIGDGPDNEVLKKQLPGPVSGVNATRDVFPDKVVVTWHSLVGATGYRIFRHAFASPGAAVQVASVAGDVGEFEDTSVPPGIWHSYWVRAEDEDGVGAFGVPASGRAEDAAGDSKRAETPISEAATAPLIDMPWEDAAAGLFEGLVRDAADGRTQVGVVERMVVSRPRAGSGLGGAASATLRMNGRAASLRGVFDATGQLTADLRQKDGSRIIADLRLMEPTGVGEETIVGTISWHGATALADLPRSPYHAKSNPVPTAIAGAHTMILPALPGWGVDEPGGDGWATVNIAAGGLVTVAGNLGDGTKFSESAHLSGEAEPAFSLFAQLYRSVPLTGHLGGRLTLRNQPDISDFDGVLRWLKFPDQREARYQGGYDIEVWALGSRYAAPARGVRVLGQLANQEHNAELSLIGPTAPGGGGALDRVVTWKPTNALAHYGPEILGASAAPKNGLLNGSYFDPVSRLKVAFTGIAFQKQGLAAGVFVNGAASGAVRILPGTAFDYPGSEAAGNLTRVEPPGALANDPVKESPAFTSAAAGIYGGVLMKAGLVAGAIEDVNLSATGAISGTLWIEGVRHSFKGVLGINPIVIPRKNLPSLHLTLTLTRNQNSADGHGLAGNVAIVGVADPLGGIDAQRRPVFSKTNRSPHEGAHTIAMRAPDGIDPLVAPGGDAHGTLVVGPLGTCTGLVTLPEGTKASLGGHLGATYDELGDPKAEWSFHRGLYGRVPRGYLAGKLYFRETEDIGDLDGQWRWVKQAGAAPATVYPGGIDTVRAVVGSSYSPLTPAPRAMGGLANDWFNLWLRFAGPDLSTLPALNLTELDRAATWTAANQIVYFGPETVKITYHLKTGLMTGSYFDAANGVNVKFGGVLLQDQNLVTGSYTVPGPAGTVSGLFSAEGR